MMLYNFVDGYQCSGGMQCLHIQQGSAYKLYLYAEDGGDMISSKTFVTTYKTT
jgi:hypothetical protein